MDTQSRLRKESKNIVFDGSKPDNLWCCNDYMLLLYLWGKLPAIPGLGMKIGMDKETGSFVAAAFGPANQERDDHVILVKNFQPPRSKRVERVIISQLIADFDDDKFDQLICEMKKIIVTQTTRSRKKQKLFDRIITKNKGGSIGIVV